MNIFRIVCLLILAVWGLPCFGAGAVQAAADEPQEVSDYPTLDSLFTLYQPYLGNLSPYEPIYFLVGTDPAKSKFQFSFRYRFFNSEGPLAAEHPWVNGLHFGYTQTSFWDLGSDSAPFEDTSYKPELFHLSSNWVNGRNAVQGLFLQTGLHHESNGRGEDESRSSNILYFRPILIFYNKASQLGLQFSPRAWLYVKKSPNNRDLPDYRGYFELEAKAGKADNLVVGTVLRWAKEGGSVQLDATYPVHKALSDNMAIYLYAQYVSALGESLLHYRERTEALRLGVSFLR